MIPLAIFALASALGQQPPPVMLWAWEAPQDLRALDPSRTGVAFLAACPREVAAGGPLDAGVDLPVKGLSATIGVGMGVND